MLWCVDRASLEQLLDQGLSLAEIGRRFDLHEATVSYWAKKHSLEAAKHAKHVSRGGIAREDLEPLIEAGMSIAQIAESVGRSKATVRHWLTRHELKTFVQQGRLREGSTRAAKAAGRATVMRRCRRHGVTQFWLEGRGYYRCKRCRMERVSQRRASGDGEVRAALRQLPRGGRGRACKLAWGGHDPKEGGLEWPLAIRGSSIGRALDC